MLPDDVLLEIFDFCVDGCQVIFRSRNEPDIVLRDEDAERMVEWWRPLVRVCRRRRGLVFQSPRRLDLQLCCTPGSVTRKTLDLWPALPLFIRSGDILDKPVVMDELTSALEHSNRIGQIHLHFRLLTTSQFEKVWTAMQVPFPELTALSLEVISGRSPSETVPVLPDSFLGGSTQLHPLAFHFRDCKNYFYLPLTSSNSPLEYSSFRVHFT